MSQRLCVTVTLTTQLVAEDSKAVTASRQDHQPVPRGALAAHPGSLGASVADSAASAGSALTREQGSYMLVKTLHVPPLRPGV